MGLLGSLFGSKPNFNNVQSPYQQVEAIYPGLKNLTATAGNNTQALLSGQVPSDVSENIKNYAAAWGLGSGTGSGAGTVGGNLTLKDLGLTSLGEEQQGFDNYLKFLTGTSSSMMNPELQSEIAVGKASPNPIYGGLEKLTSGGAGMLLGSGLLGGLASGIGDLFGDGGGGNESIADFTGTQ